MSISPSTSLIVPGLVRYELGRRWTAADEVHQVLQRLVISGALKPGERLTEVNLASQLKVSRTPLRHALQRLVSEGWLFRSANGAMHVVNVSEDEIEALYAVRTALEELMISQAAKLLTSAALNELREILLVQDQAAKSDNAELVSAQGERFHQALWRLSGNQVGARLLEDVLQRTTRYRRLSFSVPYRFREGSKQHWQILRALEAGDLALACRLLRTHVEQSRNYVMQAFQVWRDGEQRKSNAVQQRSLAEPRVGNGTPKKGLRYKRK